MNRVFGLAICSFPIIVQSLWSQQPDPPFTIDRTVATQGFDGKQCWVHARAGAIPIDDSTNNIVMTLQRLQLSGSDVFYALNEMRTSNGGISWSEPAEHSSFARVPFAFDDQEELEITVCDFTPKWHAKTGKLLGTGHTVVYENNKVRRVRPRETAYAVYDPRSAKWSPWQTLKMPQVAKFQNAGAGSVQRLDLPDGDVLLPIYFKAIGQSQYATTVVRCSFDGTALKYLEHGNELTIPIKRGLYEPSITQFSGRYFLTMRNDDHGYVSVSHGDSTLQFSKPKKWAFDDGQDLGNYNTQQHWVVHPRHGLWLVYTRRGAGNDHVFRHRGPLFIAKVNPEKLHVIRATEQILVPENGARLGNFGVTEISHDETWVTVTEWMQGPAPHHHDPRPLVARGADNRVWVAKINWTPSPEPIVKRYGNAPTQSAVRVDNASLAHTTQLFSKDHSPDDVFDQLSTILAGLGASKNDLVKLNLYADDKDATSSTLEYLSQWCPQNAGPAVSTVVTELPDSRKLALDAVFVARNIDGYGEVVHRVSEWGKATTSVLPKGDVVYVSGQAKPGDLATATKSTLAGLVDSLKFLKLGRSDIVRIKCFLNPMAKVDVVNQEIAEFFAGSVVPAVSHVQWIAGNSRPIEIEIVAAAPLTETSESVSYLTPPGLKASGVFSRISRIHDNRRIYLSGLTSDEIGDGAGQVHSIFQKMIRQLKPTQSNLRHMAKATYYVSDNDSSSQLNKIRPHYYDPVRPPAASKAMVRGTGVKRRSIAIDMIAAPEPTPTNLLTTISNNLTPTRKTVYKTVDDRPLHLHIFEPDGFRTEDRRPVFLAIHGGGWTSGNAQSFYPFAAHFAQQGMVGISLEYRLLRDGNVTVFDCVRDTRSAIRWIREHANQLGIDPSKIVAMGGSAGGHLAVSTVLGENIDEDAKKSSVSATPNALIMMYPVIDTSAEGYGQAKIGKRWREVSPLHNVSRLPPALIFHGTGDDVTPYVGIQKFQDSSTSLGNISQLITHPGGRHGYIIFDRKQFDGALKQMEKFLARHKVLP